VFDDYTTLPPTHDRIAATAMDASWTWRGVPADYTKANAAVLATMLEVFATTYSKGVQDSLYRMGEAALEAVPELATISMACPNKHYIPMKLDAFGMSSDNTVFIATDEPHGQIECTVGR
jgi:urate oxidase